ncbi:FAD/NAD(P)-binding oxidoreductase [Cyanobium sp. LEGE 06113]|uniref:NAD(P)/FAD-dependent oxidoreductase n=1 Tax=Cyanobium sp. LEGE 06113 TaxID=1297573 RepID=UPI00351C33A8
MAHHQILIVGGGAAGITAAAQLKRARPGLDVAILEPSSEHYYQPGWTLVGGGVFSLEETRRAEGDVIPSGVQWIRAGAAAFDPERAVVTSTEGEAIHYDVLIVAAGLRLCWEKIEGLSEALGKGGVCSNYSKHYTAYTWEAIEAFKGGSDGASGNAVFTCAPMPIKCPGAPQKIAYLADDVFKKKRLQAR